MEVFKDARGSFKSFFTAQPREETPVETSTALATQNSQRSEASTIPELQTMDHDKLSERAIRNIMANAKTTRSRLRAHHILKQEYRELQQHHEEVRRENEELQRLNEELRHDYDLEKSEKYALEQENVFFQSRYHYIVQEVIDPYAQDIDTTFDNTDVETMTTILHPLVRDATDARPLRGKVNDLYDKLAASKTETRASQTYAQTCEKELHLLQEEARTFKGFPQTLMEELRTKLQNAQEQKQQWQAKAQSLQEQEQVWRVRTQSLQEQLRSLREEAQASQEQVQILQKEMLARVEKVEAVSDERFAQTFRTLVAAVKSLSRSVHFGNSSAILGVLSPGTLLLDVKEHHWRPRPHHKFYIEAWTWSVLLDLVFANPLSIYGESMTAFAANWKYLFGKDHFDGWPSPAVLCEKNRCSMTAQLTMAIGEKIVATGAICEEGWDQLTVKTQALVGSLLKHRTEVTDVIHDRLSTVSSAMDTAQIRVVIDKAFALALQLSLQKCRLQLTYPAVGARFERGKMSSMPGDDVDDGFVAFIVNPGLTKWGDANGNNLDQRYDIVPALVQLEV